MDYGPPLPDLIGPPPWKCPRCGSELLDLRGQGFNGEAVRREGKCFLFNENSFECVVRAGADGQPFGDDRTHPLHPDNWAETKKIQFIIMPGDPGWRN